MMCAIVDADIAWEVFGLDRPEAGIKFFDRINSGKLSILVGGQLRNELSTTKRTDQWIQQALISGKAKLITKGVNELTEQLNKGGMCKSDDPHVIALAKIGGGRLLYSNDTALRDDFKNRYLIDKPRGKVYSTRINRRFSDSHKRLLARTDLCRF